MIFWVRVIAILISAFGIIFILKPHLLNQIMSSLAQGKRIYAAAVIETLMSVILLLAASEARKVGWIVLLGVIYLLGGILTFVLGLEKVKSIIDWWQSRSILVLQFWSILLLLFGVLILYSA